MKNNTRSQRAIAATEVLVALTVLAVALVPTLSASMSIGKQSGFTRAQAVAHLRAASQLEIVAARGFSVLAKAAEANEALDAAADDVAALPFKIVSERTAFRMADDRVGVLTVELDWRLPGDSVLRHASAFRMLAQADDSWTVSIPLPAVSGPPTPAD